MNITLPTLLFFGFLLVWLLVYWVFPSILKRLRKPRETSNQVADRFLSETGTIHRLGRRTSSDNP